MLTDKEIQFIIGNESCDTDKLLLSASRYPDINIPICVNCIIARRKLKIKVPQWLNYPSLLFPTTLSLEQCSSESTALYKQRFISKGDTVADLTGGLGVDTWAFALKADYVDYFEWNEPLSRASKYNFSVLGLHNINVTNANINVLITDNKVINNYSLIYVDPSRRGANGEKIYSIKDCSPDILGLKSSLFSISNNILIKISPMADISFTLSLLPETTQIHIVSVDNECKEILFLLEKNSILNNTPIYAVNIYKGIENTFLFSANQEKESVASYMSPEDLSSAKCLNMFLYEPNRSILKGGAFKFISSFFKLRKISKDSHIYIGNSDIENFPGKIFKILDIFDFNKLTIKNLNKTYPKASISSKGFPISSSSLQERLKISEDDKYHIFACTSLSKTKKLICTEVYIR